MASLPQHMIPTGSVDGTGADASLSVSTRTVTTESSHGPEESSCNITDHGNASSKDKSTCNGSGNKRISSITDHSEPSSICSQTGTTTIMGVVTENSSLSSLSPSPEKHPQREQGREKSRLASNLNRPTRESVLRRLSEALMRRSLTMVSEKDYCHFGIYIAYASIRSS